MVGIIPNMEIEVPVEFIPDAPDYDADPAYRALNAAGKTAYRERMEKAAQEAKVTTAPKPESVGAVDEAMPADHVEDGETPCACAKCAASKEAEAEAGAVTTTGITTESGLVPYTMDRGAKELDPSTWDEEDAKCATCEGTGKIKEGHVSCPDCGGTGKAAVAKVEKSAATDERFDELRRWQNKVEKSVKLGHTTDVSFHTELFDEAEQDFIRKAWASGVRPERLRAILFDEIDEA